MKIFVYTFKNKTGKVVKAKVRAAQYAQAKAFLKNNQITPISLKEEKESLYDKLFTDKTVQPDEIVTFTQLFSSCIQTGLTIKETLELLGKQIENKTLQSRIADIIVDIEAGNSISVAFAKHTDIFPVFYPMLLKAGEASGDLSKILDYLGQYLERINNLKKELYGVFTYPAIVSAVGAGLLSLILIFVAPTFRDVFAESGVPLPMPTKVLFFLSDLLLKYYPIVLFLFLCLAGTYVLLSRSYQGKRQIHYFYLNMPMLGKVIKEATLLRFLRAFDVLVNNDVPLLEALKVLEEGTTNIALKEIVTDMRKEVAKGLPLSGPLLRSKKIINPMISHSISMGEQSGNLGITLSRLSHFVDREITFSMKKLSARLDPMLTMGLGSMVLFIALAIYLPIFDMMSTQT